MNQTTMKKYFIGLALLATLVSCDTKEKQALQNKVDSLDVELNIRKDLEANMNEVGVLIDSIDASRKSLQLRMVEGKSYSDYVSRLKEINVYIQQTETKLAQLEKSSNNSSKASKASVRRLKADLAKRTEEILELQTQIAKARTRRKPGTMDKRERERLSYYADRGWCRFHNLALHLLLISTSELHRLPSERSFCCLNVDSR